MTVYDGAEHDVFRQAIGLRFDHQHGRVRAGDDQVELGLGQRTRSRVQDVLAVNVTDARGADRALERHAGNCQRSGCAEQCRDVRINIGIKRDYRRDDLDLVLEALRKQRAQWPVDQAADQRFFLAGAAFALEEATRDLAGSIGLFLVVDRQREKVPARICLLATYRGDEDDGVANACHDGAIGLTRDFTGFEGDRIVTVLECLLYSLHAISLLFYLPLQKTTPLFRRGATNRGVMFGRLTWEVPASNLAAQSEALDQFQVAVLI